MIQTMRAIQRDESFWDSLVSGSHLGIREKNWASWVSLAEVGVQDFAAILQACGYVTPPPPPATRLAESLMDAIGEIGAIRSVSDPTVLIRNVQQEMIYAVLRIERQVKKIDPKSSGGSLAAVAKQLGKHAREIVPIASVMAAGAVVEEASVLAVESMTGSISSGQAISAVASAAGLIASASVVELGRRMMIAPPRSAENDDRPRVLPVEHGYVEPIEESRRELVRFLTRTARPTGEQVGPYVERLINNLEDTGQEPPVPLRKLALICRESPGSPLDSSAIQLARKMRIERTFQPRGPSLRM
ncbi:uncharacterized protein YoaH (UPF0181 family) [Friedmanniella endophytica]|uniref:Uncharacterized protein YoaH (UPF0181 family) n=1 Tax=Microlunatus kandeliicorticis TaxID=1759536 RepID=A0A7W3P4G1_9ACTN|nr:hypothetical protein [Microlunatus kandeliicorticis]MBA8792856.1 uncharacterized protein YoaH (UPF0181 family) [Microlunatus kandeliicorticis]